MACYSVGMRTLCLALFAFSLLAQNAQEFRDVHMFVRDQGGGTRKSDGALWLSRKDSGAVFISDHKPLGMVFYGAIGRMTYDEKNKRTLMIYYKDSRGEEQFAQFELRGGDRSNLLATIETQSGLKIDRLGQK